MITETLLILVASDIECEINKQLMLFKIGQSNKTSKVKATLIKEIEKVEIEVIFFNNNQIMGKNPTAILELKLNEILVRNNFDVSKFYVECFIRDLHVVGDDYMGLRVQNAAFMRSIFSFSNSFGRSNNKMLLEVIVPDPTKHLWISVREGNMGITTNGKYIELSNSDSKVEFMMKAHEYGELQINSPGVHFVNTELVPLIEKLRFNMDSSEFPGVYSELLSKSKTILFTKYGSFVDLYGLIKHKSIDQRIELWTPVVNIILVGGFIPSVNVLPTGIVQISSQFSSNNGDSVKITVKSTSCVELIGLRQTQVFVDCTARKSYGKKLTLVLKDSNLSFLSVIGLRCLLSGLEGDNFLPEDKTFVKFQYHDTNPTQSIENAKYLYEYFKKTDRVVETKWFHILYLNKLRLHAPSIYEKMALWYGFLSNNYGYSWTRALSWILFVFAGLACFLWSNDALGIAFVDLVISVLTFSSPPKSLEGIPYIYTVVGTAKILYGILLYQFVVAFRRTARAE